MINSTPAEEWIDYGDPIVGIWYCRECHYQCFPRKLDEAGAKPPFRCPDCGTTLDYDEEE